MRPTSTTFSAPIAAPLEKVFALLSTTDAYPRWLPGCQTANTLGALKKGSRVSITFGADRSTILEIVDFTPPSSIGWADRGDRRGSRVFFQLYFAGGATTLSMKDVWEPKRITDLVKGRIFKRLPTVRGDSEQIRKNLADVLLAQGYQDLTGQVIRSVIKLVGELEEALASLTKLSGDLVEHATLGENPDKGHGPVVPGVTRADVASGQTDVDELLSGLGM